MIFRHRRTRIEIEQTTVRVASGSSCPADPDPAVATAPPSPIAAVLARVLPFPAREPTEANAQPAVTTIPKPAAKENRP